MLNEKISSQQEVSFVCVNQVIRVHKRLILVIQHIVRLETSTQVLSDNLSCREEEYDRVSLSKVARPPRRLRRASLVPRSMQSLRSNESRLQNETLTRVRSSN